MRSGSRHPRPDDVHMVARAENTGSSQQNGPGRQLHDGNGSGSGEFRTWWRARNRCCVVGESGTGQIVSFSKKLCSLRQCFQRYFQSSKRSLKIQLNLGLRLSRYLKYLKTVTKVKPYKKTSSLVWCAMNKEARLENVRQAMHAGLSDK